MKILSGLFLGLFACLQFQLWLGNGGLLEMQRMTKAVNQQKQTNEQLVQRNTVLIAEVVDLKYGLTAIEERARSELGMIRSNETFYQRMP